ncbi:MAG: sodium:proton antiporter, partial [Cyclobacteriaceae bacterium]
MSRFVIVASIWFLTSFLTIGYTKAEVSSSDPAAIEANVEMSAPLAVVDVEEVEADVRAHPTAPSWLVFPFVLLLLMIATGPLFYEHFWHKNYPIVAVVLAVLVVVYYLFMLHNTHAPVHALA